MRPIGAAILALGFLSAGPVFAQPLSSFAWFGELVSADASAVTVKVPIEAHVSRSVTKFQPGSPIVLIWAEYGDSVRYVESPAQVPADIGGYVVRGKFISADGPAKTLTFSLPAPARIVQALGTARAGTAIKLTSSMYSASGAAAPMPMAVGLNETPKPRPAKAVAAVPTGPPPASVAGNWIVDTNLMGNALKLKCNLTQDRAKLAGTCAAPMPLGDVTLSTGSVAGSAVAFQFDITGLGLPLVFTLKGDVEDSGSAMKGQVSVGGFDAPFTATKQ